MTTGVEVSGAPVSVVIPAHDEADVIGRCLDGLLDGTEPGTLEVVVVCNGCTDATAAVARGRGDDVRVVEITEANKVAALNAGDEHAHHFPRFYVDADVVVSGKDLRKVAQVLREQDDVLAASPGLNVDVSGSSWVVRRYYRFWQTLPQITGDLTGRGCYGTSEMGRRAFDRFPDLIADDLFFRTAFLPEQRRSVPGTTSTVIAPRTVRGLVRRRIRVVAGNAQLIGAELPRATRSALLRALRPEAVTTGHTLDACVFLGVGVVSRCAGWWLRRRSTTVSWGADDSRPAALAP